MLTVFERESITAFVGPQEGKIAFLQSFPGIVRFGSKDTVFNVSGIFQIPKGPPILVLPWFLKDNAEILADKGLGKRSGEFFDLINQIRTFDQTSIDLEASATALDIVIHSFLLSLLNKVREAVSYNFHEDISEELNVIKGRWNIATDLRKGEIPLKFTCNYNSLIQDIPILIFTKSLAKWLEGILTAKNNHRLLEEILVLLKDVSPIPLSAGLARDAKAWATKRRGYEGWTEAVAYAEGLILNRQVYSREAGLSYQFRMDQFFETVVFRLCQLIPGTTVRTQQREELLGGAVWEEQGLTHLDDDPINARMTAIPDIIIEGQTSFSVLECKYKPFRIPLINSSSTNPDLVRYGRGDRNQLLSFLLSLRPSNTLSRKRPKFFVIFPCREIPRLEASTLSFSSASMSIDPMVRNISQNRGELEGDHLSIKFLGLNVSAAIKEILHRETTLSQELASHFMDVSAKLPEVPPTGGVVDNSFMAALQRRLALSSMIVNEGRNDKNMGRVKLAKVFYLADTHLSLNMRAEYARFARGPYDDRLVKHEKWGIESNAQRQALYQVQQTSKENEEKDRIRYLPGINIATITAKAPTLFPGKVENILALIRLLLPLNSVRSEIVATLYACWNDFKIAGRTDITDELIINEFRTRWHQSKARFTPDRLQKALDWMREHGLEPHGTGTRTRQLSVQQAANF